ncbi:hypothetical protein QJS10_CPA01g00800 [Acorus calamus]|uniref:Succinate dehydrogenase subunit 6, mitochondrial n=1 Tax=Acorus calamus TaxID=4465 RepID=A0AAV9FNZ3_ACOCL|nr:hypothetical protein QJS10_CPA01g00800 [Acorus calamus]
MAVQEGSSSSSSTATSMVSGYLSELKQFWKARFSFLDYHKKILGREEPLPRWTSDDVEEFIASDPVYGPQLRTVRQATKIANVGALIGAVTTAGVSYKYSKVPHGAVLAFGAGALFGFTFGGEIANHWLQIYRLEREEATLRFFYWWEDKCTAKGLLPGRPRE